MPTKVGLMGNKKVVVVGDGASGKTCLISILKDGTFPQFYVPTVVDSYCVPVIARDTTFYLGIWDTAGQEEFGLLSHANTKARRPLTIGWAAKLLRTIIYQDFEGISKNKA